MFLVFVAAVTAIGQCLAWVVELIRTLPGGVWAVRLCAVALVAAGALLLHADVLVSLLTSAPTAVLTDQVTAAARGELSGLAVSVAVSAAVAAVAVLGGARLLGVLLQRPTVTQTRSETSTHRVRQLPSESARWADLRVWRAQDWAIVWRSVPLRRGLVLLLLAPPAGGLVARIGWPDLGVLCAVVTVGAALLFGINMFALDGEGAVWRTGLPTPARVWLVSRVLVVTEIVLLTSTLTVLAAMVSARGEATATVAIATVLAIPTMTVQVVSRCLRWSIEHPERAELRDSRDSPVSPGRMMLASLQLMGPTMGMGIVLGVAARIGLPWLPVLLVLPTWFLGVRSMRISARRWDDDVVRAAVVQAVSRG